MVHVQEGEVSVWARNTLFLFMETAHTHDLSTWPAARKQSQRHLVGSHLVLHWNLHNDLRPFIMSHTILPASSLFICIYMCLSVLLSADKYDNSFVREEPPVATYVKQKITCEYNCGTSPVLTTLNEADAGCQSQVDVVRGSGHAGVKHSCVCLCVNSECP